MEAKAEKNNTLIISLVDNFALAVRWIRQWSSIDGQCVVTAKTKLKIRSGADEPGQGQTSPESHVKLMQSCDLVLVVVRQGANVFLRLWDYTESRMWIFSVTSLLCYSSRYGECIYCDFKLLIAKVKANIPWAKTGSMFKMSSVWFWDLSSFWQQFIKPRITE